MTLLSNAAGWRGAIFVAVSFVLMAPLGMVDAARAALSAHATIEPSAIQLGQQARLTISVRGVQSSPTPRLPDLDGVDVGSLGQTVSVQIINGQMESEGDGVEVPSPPGILDKIRAAEARRVLRPSVAPPVLLPRPSRWCRPGSRRLTSR